MSSSLSRVPVPSRRRMAATLGLFTALFVAVGAVALTGRGTAAAPVFAVIAFLVAALLGLMAWGVVRSIHIDLAEQELDAVIDAALAPSGGRAQLCGCGHEHDPDELQVTDAEDACAHDGSGAACAHDCSTCVLASMRPSPTAARSERLGG